MSPCVIDIDTAKFAHYQSDRIDNPAEPIWQSETRCPSNLSTNG